MEHVSRAEIDFYKMICDNPNRFKTKENEFLYNEKRWNEFAKEDVCEIAVHNGWLDLLIYAQEKNYSLDSRSCEYAAEHNHFHILKYLVEKGNKMKAKVCTNAILNDNLEMLHWAIDNGCPLDMTSCWAAASKGNLDLLKWIININPEIKLDWRVCKSAAEIGDLDILIWARDSNEFKKNNPDIVSNKMIYESAARNNQYIILQWAIDNNFHYHWNDEIAKAAATEGHFDLLKWICENININKDDIFNAAASRCHLDIAKWLYSNDHKFDEFESTLCSSAIGYGNLEMLCWLRQIGCPWNIMACFSIQKYYNEDISHWMLANGCVCNGTLHQ